MLLSKPTITVILLVQFIGSTTSFCKAESSAVKTLDQAANRAAEYAVQNLKKQGTRRIRVMDFANRDPNLTTAAGNSFKHRVVEQLKTKFVDGQLIEVVNKGQCNYGLYGEIRIGRKYDPTGGLLKLKVLFTVNGAEQGGQDIIGVIDPAEVAQITGQNLNLDGIPGGDRVQPTQLAGQQNPEKPVLDANQIDFQKNVFFTSLENPSKPRLIQGDSSLIQGENNRVDSIVYNQESPYGVEIRVKHADDEFHPLPVQLVDGEPFVDIPHGAVFQVCLYNDSSYDSGATVYIDGFSTFAFSENDTYRASNRWVVKKESKGTIKGWHIKNQGSEMELAEFVLDKYAKQPIADFGNPEDIGTITVLFCAAWKEGEQPPPSQKGALRGVQVGHRFHAPLVEHHRLYGTTRATVSIRYERKNNAN